MSTKQFAHGDVKHLLLSLDTHTRTCILVCCVLVLHTYYCKCKQLFTQTHSTFIRFIRFHSKFLHCELNKRKMCTKKVELKQKKLIFFWNKIKILQTTRSSKMLNSCHDNTNESNNQPTFPRVSIFHSNQPSTITVHIVQF